MSSSNPPAYPQSPPYSLDPHPDETQLARTSIRTRRSRPTGIFTTSKNGIVLALRGQEDGASIPSYGRNSTISGDIGLESTEDVVAVSVKLQGVLDLTVTGVASQDSTFLSKSSTIWEQANSSAHAPSMLPFEVAIPQSHQDAGSARPLPPTYAEVFPGVRDLHVKCCYTLTVYVTRSGLWKPRKSMSVQFAYQPRTRPHRPIISSPFPFSTTIRSLPEEWHQVSSTMRSRADSGVKPIECQLFIPAVRIYSITDTVPFYLQLCAPTASLEAFLHPRPPPPSMFRLSKAAAAFDDSAQPTVSVSFMRQIEAVVGSHHAFRSFVIGEGTLRPVPPDVASSTTLVPPADGYQTLNWEGEIKCQKNVTDVGFSVGKLMIKDHIRLQLVPPSPKTSPLLEHEHLHTIRLVTDSFMEGREYDF